MAGQTDRHMEAKRERLERLSTVSGHDGGAEPDTSQTSAHVPPVQTKWVYALQKGPSRSWCLDENTPKTVAGGNCWCVEGTKGREDREDTHVGFFPGNIWLRTQSQTSKNCTGFHVNWQVCDGPMRQKAMEDRSQTMEPWRIDSGQRRADPEPQRTEPRPQSH